MSDATPGSFKWISSPSAIGKYFPVELGVVADAGAAARAISAELSRPIDQWAKWTNEFQTERSLLDRDRALEAGNDATPMHPTRALAEIREALPHDAIVTIDTGNTCLQAAGPARSLRMSRLDRAFGFRTGRIRLRGSGRRASRSTGTPRCPQSSGTGGFGYAMADVMTAVQYGLPVVAVILDNKAWGAEKAYQLEFFGGRVLGADLENPDFGRYAEICGAAGRRVSKPGQLGPAVKDALAKNRPSVIHVDIDPTAHQSIAERPVQFAIQPSRNPKLNPWRKTACFSFKFPAHSNSLLLSCKPSQAQAVEFDQLRELTYSQDRASS